MQFERLNAANGPTGGQIAKKDGTAPKKIALVHCVGSRTEKHRDYCSGVCCLYSMKFIHHLKHKIPGVEISDYYQDFCFPGKESQKFANEELKSVEATRVSGDISAEQTSDGIKIISKPKRGKSSEKIFDMVILAPSIVPNSDAKKLAEMFDLALDERGFFKEDHPKLDAHTSSFDGVGIAGTAQCPKPIEQAITQAAASSGKLLSQLVPGRMLAVETKTAYIVEELCSGCKMCIAMCPYSAISFNPEKKISEVNEVLCKGCGTCVATCPSGSAQAKHFTRDQIRAELEEVVR
jgi:heterodisulfide reductase subunit A